MELTPRNDFPTKDNNAINYLLAKRPREPRVVDYRRMWWVKRLCSVGALSLEISGLMGRIDGRIHHHNNSILESIFFSFPTDR